MSHPTTTVDIAGHFNALKESITRLGLNYGRDAANVHLLAVSKTRSSAEIRECVAAGQRQFAENYLQEALKKIIECADLELTWHFIGRVQRNKTRDLATHFAWVHTLDRPDIAKRLHDQRPPILDPLNVCIQVNLDGSDTKGGISAEQVPQLANTIAGMNRLRLRGLMTIPEATDNLASQRRPYRRLAELLQELVPEHPAMDTLSMGMSGDMEAAIAEGATQLRIGTALFGPRSAPV